MNKILNNKGYSLVDTGITLGVMSLMAYATVSSGNPASVIVAKKAGGYVYSSLLNTSCALKISRKSLNLTAGQVQQCLSQVDAFDIVDEQGNANGLVTFSVPTYSGGNTITVVATPSNSTLISQPFDVVISVSTNPITGAVCMDPAQSYSGSGTSTFNGRSMKCAPNLTQFGLL